MCSVDNDTESNSGHPNETETAMSRKYIAVGLLAGVTAGTGAGLILQQTGSAGAASAAVAAPQQDDGTDTGTETETDATGTADRPSGDERLAEVLAPLVAGGTITQAQADAVVEALAPARPEGGHGGRSHHARRGPKLDVVAEVLGVTVEELRTQLRSGATVADIAGDQTQAVIDALVAEATARIEAEVTAGELTREDAEEKLAGMVERITERVNTGRPGGPPEQPATDDTDG
jgi:polyhydroxyalkanoate synthesis regulator phasin